MAMGLHAVINRFSDTFNYECSNYYEVGTRKACKEDH